MKIRDIILEGGWDTTKTQSTVLHPRIVSVALGVVDQFVADFNQFLHARGIAPVKRGRPTGSSAHHEVDAVKDPEKVYGDIDLQMIGSPVEGAATYGQFVNYWNSLADEFVKQARPNYVDTSESKPGHPIFQVGGEDFVQIDFMWHEPTMADWGATRVTPERGVKGLLFGNMFSVLGELIDMSIQHAGVQLKVVDGKHVPFSKQKDTKVVTVTANPRTFIYDIFKYEAEQQNIKNPAVDAMLRQFPGANIDEPKIQHLVNGVRGLAQSFELNNMYGKGDLERYSSAEDFLNQFLQRYEQKAMADVTAKKREKAATPQAIARAKSDREKVLTGLETVKGYFA